MILSGRYGRRLAGGAGIGMAVCITLAATMAMAQGSASPAQAGSDAGAKLPDWDVASIKQAEPSSCTGGAGSWLTPDGLVFHCDPLMFVVESAYQIMEPSRIIGAPEWLKNGGLWEIHAKV